MNGSNDYSIPIGTEGMDLAFGGDVRNLVFANGAFTLGTPGDDLQHPFDRIAMALIGLLQGVT